MSCFAPIVICKIYQKFSFFLYFWCATLLTCKNPEDSLLLYAPLKSLLYLPAI